MNRLNILMSTSACLLALTAGVRAQGNAGVPSSTRSDETHAPYRPAHTQVAEPSWSGPITKMNKASKLIGMDVHNAQNQKLGSIEDLALDLQSGKIGYAVLSVGGFLGLGDKYIAVPIDQLRPAPNGDGLVLNVDKSQIQNAPGFAKTEWPALNAVGESAWWEGAQTAQGAPATVHSETGAARSGNEPAKEFSGSARHQTVHGRITSLNRSSGTLTVSDAAGSQEFKVDKNAMIRMSGKPNAELSDLKQGDSVSVTFHQENGSDVADSINASRQGPPEVK